MKKKFILRTSHDTVTVYGGGQEEKVHIPEDMDPESIPLNGQAFVEEIGGKTFIIAHRDVGSFTALMEAE